MSLLILSNCSNNTTENNNPDTADSTETITETPTNNEGPLFKVFEGEEDFIGVKTGYVNAQGDTVIAMGKYKYCFTDTLKTIAIVMDQDNLFKAIDVNDNILYQVKTYDNGPDYISDGLFRIIIDGKTGYANEAGEIIIQPQYACTSPFEDGKARVALKCELIKEDEHTRMESDEWFFIDTSGNRIEE